MFDEMFLGVDEAARDVTLLLREKKLRAAFAESCTGGMLAAALTSVPGSSLVFEAGMVAYADWVKKKYVGVTGGILAAYGAVSFETACAMADGIRREVGSDIGVGVTGIAGPGGGSAEKPVGTVYIAAAFAGGTVAKRFVMSYGDRRLNRVETVRQALVLLRDYLRRS
ncbi:MAG: CinA family protein [Oscillospiraceae bacterium]|jgi:PncC family amidohydrolase|nr:CinA family protein [Oscillospiraceae bacterium]